MFTAYVTLKMIKSVVTVMPVASVPSGAASFTPSVVYSTIAPYPTGSAKGGKAVAYGTASGPVGTGAGVSSVVKPSTVGVSTAAVSASATPTPSKYTGAASRMSFGLGSKVGVLVAGLVLMI